MPAVIVTDSKGRHITVGDYVQLQEPVYKYKSNIVLLPEKSVVQVVKIEKEVLQVVDILDSSYLLSTDSAFLRVKAGKVRSPQQTELTSASTDSNRTVMSQRCVNKAMVVASNAQVEDDPAKLARLGIAATFINMASRSELDISRQNRLLTLAMKLV